MANYKKDGKIGDVLFMENKDGKITDAGIVTDFKDGKIITKDADGKKHQYSGDNKKIVGFLGEEKADEPASIADTAPKKPVIASESSSKEINEKVTTESLEAIPEVFTGIVNTQKALLNIRADADKKSKIIGTLRKGEQIKLTGEGGWYKLSDRDGFVDASFIQKI